MNWSSRRALLLAASAAVATTACDSPTETTVPSAKNPSLEIHGTGVGCVDGAARVDISVYPNSITVGGENATPYASVSGPNGEELRSLDVRFSIADTTIVHVTGTDSNGRPILTARKAGVTQVTGTCGDLSDTKQLTVTGGGGETTATGTPTLTLRIPTASLAQGQSVQAEVAPCADCHPLSGATWASSNAGVASVTSTGQVTAVGAGTSTITATVGQAFGSVVVTVTAGSQTPPTQQTPPPPASSGVTATRPSLPQSTPTVGPMPSASREIRVPSGGDLQAALNSAQPGDAILLAPGAAYVGNFVLRAKGGGSSCGSWITLRTDGSIPAAGQRVSPSSASGFAKLQTPNSMPALATEPKANCYRISGLEIGVPSWLTVYNYGLVSLGDGGWVAGGDKQVSMDLVPLNLVLDHLYVHGETTSNFTRCVALNSGTTAIVDSWIGNCHARGFDAQAIGGWNGPGPYLIENNFLAGAGENIMFGGGDPAIPNLVPSDITIRRNHVYKDPSWRGVWTAKNLLELKSARRVLIEGNVFENSWIDAQMGMAIVIKSALGTPNGGRWQGTTDVTFRSNIVRNAHRGFNVEAHDGPTDNPVARVRAENNLFENIGDAWGTGVDGWLMLLVQDFNDVAVVHNTMIGNLPGRGTAVQMDAGGARRLQLDDNVLAGQNEYALFYSGARVGTASITAMAGDSWSFAGNVVANVNPDYASWHPAASWYPPTTAGIGFAGGGDYSLGSASIYRGKATDGRDPGADMNELRRQTNGVVIP